MVGKPVITGTRLTVDFIIGCLAAGDTVEEIVEQYEVTREQIQACLAYAADALSEVWIYMLPMARRR